MPIPESQPSPEPPRPNRLGSPALTGLAAVLLIAIAVAFYGYDVAVAPLGFLGVFLLAGLGFRRAWREVAVAPSFGASAALVAATVVLAIPAYALLFFLLFLVSLSLHYPFG